MVSEPKSRTIARLNDAFRRTLAGGMVNMTAGVAALPRENWLLFCKR